MGILTLQQFLNELRFDLRNRSDTGTSGLSDDRLTFFLNMAMQHITHPSVHRHRAMQFRSNRTLVSGINSYVWNQSAATESFSIRYVYHILDTTDVNTAQHIKLLPRDERWLAQRSISSGPPKIYCVQGNNILLDPVPSANENGQLLSISTWQMPAVFTTSNLTAVSALTSQWDEVLLLGARWRAERDLGYVDRAELTRQHYAAMINEYADQQNLETEDWDFQPGIADYGSPMESL